jgi:Ca-activated chloride channel family protein
MLSELLRATLERTGIDAFEQPWVSLLGLLVLAALVLAARTRPAAIGWSAYRESSAAGARRLDPVRAISLLMRAGALLALVAVLAGPIGQHRLPPEPGFGLDLVLVVDASGSMRALDAQRDGDPRTRFALAREVVARFAEKRAAAGDRVALVVFGESAFTQCPLTSDGALLSAALTRIEAGVAGESTALGDALALAVKRASGATRDLSATPDGAGRVIVLLTDGRNNAGAISVELASSLAASAGIRVHTVGIGSGGDPVAMAPNRPSARAGHSGLPGVAARREFERHDVDTDALRGISIATEGRFFAVRDSRDLDAVYRDIDTIERVARPLPPRIHHSQRPEPLLALAGSFLLLELSIARVAWRRIP